MSILPKGESIQIREVWNDNLKEEFELIKEIVDAYPYVAMDTEFSGIVLRPVGNFKTSSDYHYQTLKANVDMLKLIHSEAYQDHLFLRIGLYHALQTLRSRTLHQHSDYVTCLAAAEKNGNLVASGGLGAEVFIWDLESALAPVSKLTETMEEDSSNGVISGNSGLPIASLHPLNSTSSISSQKSQPRGYSPISAKGHKESVYALAMNDSGTLLVSGGTEKVVRVWDPRTGARAMKLRGHTDNVRALIFDSTGRFCLSGSSDSMIRLWDLGQQRCVHSYAVHIDSVWALASTPNFSHVYSGGRDQSLYLTDLATRESLLLCTKESPIAQLALHEDSIWVATTESSVNRWPAEGHNPQKLFHRGGSFLAGNLSFTRARASLEGRSPISLPFHLFFHFFFMFFMN